MQPHTLHTCTHNKPCPLASAQHPAHAAHQELQGQKIKETLKKTIKNMTTYGFKPSSPDILALFVCLTNQDVFIFWDVIFSEHSTRNNLPEDYYSGRHRSWFSEKRKRPELYRKSLIEFEWVGSVYKKTTTPTIKQNKKRPIYSNFDSLIVTKRNSSSQLHQINFFLTRENNWSVSAATKSQQIRQEFIFSLFKRTNKQKTKTLKC